jgi:hypothetical protein
MPTNPHSILTTVTKKAKCLYGYHTILRDGSGCTNTTMGADTTSNEGPRSR